MKYILRYLEAPVDGHIGCFLIFIFVFFSKHHHSCCLCTVFYLVWELHFWIFLSTGSNPSVSKYVQVSLISKRKNEKRTTLLPHWKPFTSTLLLNPVLYTAKLLQIHFPLPSLSSPSETNHSQQTFWNCPTGPWGSFSVLFHFSSLWIGSFLLLYLRIHWLLCQLSSVIKPIQWLFFFQILYFSVLKCSFDFSTFSISPLRLPILSYTTSVFSLTHWA